MRKDLGVKAWMLPQPVVLIGTYDENGNPDIMNAAWAGTYEADQVMLCLSHGHKTFGNLVAAKAFTLAFPDAAHVDEADYVGLVSGNTVPDKAKRSGLAMEPSKKVNAPILTDLPIVMECEFVKLNEDGNVIGKVVNVSASEQVLNEKGEVDADKLHILSFCPVDNTYRIVDQVAGHAWSSGKNIK